MSEGVVYRFSLGDVEDPVIYAAQPILDWERSELGQWVMLNSKKVPIWNIGSDSNRYGYSVYIVADLSDENWTYFHLKFKQFSNEYI